MAKTRLQIYQDTIERERRERADERRALKREIVALNQKLKSTYSGGFRDGSGRALAVLYAAAPNDDVVNFISDLSLIARVRKAPFGLPPSLNARVKEFILEVAARQCRPRPEFLLEPKWLAESVERMSL
jgi:hypothetical protein